MSSPYDTAVSSNGSTIAITTIMMIMEEIIFFCLRLSIRVFAPLSERILYMNFIINASVLIFAAAIAIYLHKGKKAKTDTRRDFLEREREANSTRRKSLDDLDYIRLSIEEFPMDLLDDVPKVEDYKQIIQTLSERPIVNFTGINNTELKLRYGAPNIDLLTEYDQNYTVLVRTLQQWGQALYDAGYVDEACHMLEFAISTGTDVSATYRLLCRIYTEQNTLEKINDLYPVAEMLNSAMRNTIFRILQEAGQSGD